MKLKKIIAIMLSMVLAFCLTACMEYEGQDESTESNSQNKESQIESESESEGIKPEDITYQTYGSYWFPQHDYMTMPIGAYNSCPPLEGEYTLNFLESEDLFYLYNQAGVNLMMGLTDYVGLYSNSVATALDYCYEYDLAYLLAFSGASDVRSESAVRNALARVMYHDSFAGIMLSDEPGRAMFEKMANSRSVFESVLDGTSPKLYHSNLFPTYVNEKTLWFRSYTPSDVVPVESYTYQDYVNDYIEMYNPQVLSYDFYPITGAFPTLANGYFENMSIIRSAALKANIPFWTYVQTCSFNNGQRLPTLADLLWNVNTCLAYGAKGIQYFCGVLPNDGLETFDGAIFDRSGNPTQVYDIVKVANAQIKAIDEVLMCSKSQGIIVAGDMPRLRAGSNNRMTIPSEDLIANFRELLSVESDHALVGCFDYNGKTALYVVNNAIADDVTPAQTTVKLKFDGIKSGYTVQNTQKSDFGGQILNLELSAGEGVLVVVD